MPVCDVLYIQFCARPADAASDFGCGVLQLKCSVDVFALYRRSSDMTGSWGTTTIRTTENQTVTFEATGSDRSINQSLVQIGIRPRQANRSGQDQAAGVRSSASRSEPVFPALPSFVATPLFVIPTTLHAVSTNRCIH